MNILAIETSCDETSVAIVEDGRIVLSNVVASSADIQAKFGGIVPEIAARKQIEFIIPVLEEACEQYCCRNNQNKIQSHPSTNKDLDSRFGSTDAQSSTEAHSKSHPERKSKDRGNDINKEIDAIAVTIGPGLIGSLLVGVETAKTLSFIWNKPIIPVNHVLAHIYAAFLQHNYSEIRNTKYEIPRFPAIALVVSGGHTELYLMKNEKTLRWIGGTLDDAAGECFDKTARLLGLPYPGGPAIAAQAAKYEIRNTKYEINLPRPMINNDSLNFSFSGLKTAVLRESIKLKTMKPFDSPSIRLRASAQGKQFSFEIQEAITDVLVEKTLKATQIHNVKSIIVTGGVAANQRLREKFNQQLTLRLHSGQACNLQLLIPDPHLCVDSAAFVAAYAYYHNHSFPWQHIQAQPDLSVEI